MDYWEFSGVKGMGSIKKSLTCSKDPPSELLLNNGGGGSLSNWLGWEIGKFPRALLNIKFVGYICCAMDGGGGVLRAKSIWK